ncbi:creatininase family protein [Paenibacillus naphthalenovorans]|uniref:creatininase family protein n=1 Tax=Paenibacillus naphthalenovorans TaxID=162209 RepID=UPI003D2B7A75
MSFVELKYLTSSEARAVGQDRGAVGLIPIGALEQHGPHLPLVTDSALAEVLAAEVAARCREPIVVTPTIMAGLSEHHADFPGTVTLGPVTLGAVIQAYITALKRMGLTRIGLFSFHGGNFRFLGKYAAGCSSIWPGMQVAAYTDFRRFLHVMFQAGVKAGLKLASTDSHAGAIETSLALHVMGEHRVRAFEAVTGYTAGEAGWLEAIETKGVQAISPSGVFGTPGGANAGAGKVILNALSEEVAVWLKDAFKLGEFNSSAPLHERS